MSEFPNGVPRFKTKKAAVDFMMKYCRYGSNPMEPQLRQSISTLTDWNQVSTVLLPKYKEYLSRWPARKVLSSEQLSKNRFISSAPKSDARSVYDFLLSRVDLPIHKTIPSHATLNTLNYLFSHMRCGILAMIRNNELVMFCPFVNKDYRNTWGDKLQIECPDGKVESYFTQKETTGKRENYLQDKSQWWANGNIICNQVCELGHEAENQWWGDQFLLQLKDMLSETCRTREVPDCDLFLNKRDYPQIKFNEQRGEVVEPYGFIFDKDDRDPMQDVPLEEMHFRRYAPVLSFYTSERFADIPFPPSEDWEAATGEVFPPSMNYTVESEGDGKGTEPKITVGVPRDLFTRDNLLKFERPWEEKVSIAFFRGTATGGGITTATNQRLHLAQVSWEWEKDPQLNGSSGGSPFLDAKITGWNMRDKKVSHSRMDYVKKEQFPFNGDRNANFVEIYKQSTYKYVLYVEGHCAACRYGFMMQLGSVILKVDSKCVADKMWYFPLLQPYRDHIPIKADLSDLREKLEWCHTHDDECKKIAANAQQIYKEFVSREAILDYMQAVCVEIGRRSVAPPHWACDPPAPSKPPRSAHRASGMCIAGCLGCSDLLQADREAESQRAINAGAVSDQKQAEKSTKREIAEMRRARMKRLAKEEAEAKEAAAAAAPGGTETANDADDADAGSPTAKRAKT